jgi:shikimate kinase
MKIVLIGYMGSGKSSIGKQLANLLNLQFKDLDQEIELVEKQSIEEIFSNKGEIYFRKKEIEVLKSVLNENSSTILATGGGTPCFGNTMEYLNADKKSITIYLKATIDSLVNRLYEERKKRPLIAHIKSKEELKDFISKHLFERSYYYNLASIKVDTDNLSVEEISEEIKRKVLV